MPTLTSEQLAQLRAAPRAEPVGGAAVTAGAMLASGGSVTSSSAASATTELLPPAPAMTRAVRLQRGDETVAQSAGAGTASNPTGQRLGRNDPCWCGSGKKFKRCHGSS
jgi:preprotein translocase subunit SecA